MFKSARWRSERNKVKVEFKLQFHAAKLPHVGEDALVISVVPADSGKPTVKSDKAEVRDGSCFWENPVCETVKFNHDPKTGKFHERMYYFIVVMGSSDAGVIGEASIDFANYAEATKVSLVSLPLRTSKTEAVLNVSIQRVHEAHDQRGVEENVKQDYKYHSLKAHLDNGDVGGSFRSNGEDVTLKADVANISELNGNQRASSGSDITISSSESSSGVEIPWQPQMTNDGVSQVLKSEVQMQVYEERQHSSHWEWLGNSSNEATTDDSSGTPRGTSPTQPLEEALDVVVEKLKSDVAVLSRQAEMSELELQTLRKQIVKECKKGQDLYGELVVVKEERDALKRECENLRALQRCADDTKTRTSSNRFEGGDSKAVVEELKQELNHAKELNNNLRLQLQKTQESNAELLLAVQDLDEMLEQKNKEILGLSGGSCAQFTSENFQDVPKHQPDDDDDEQKALEELVKGHGEANGAYLLEQQVINLQSEIEILKRDRDELEMQMEQLALDYEILKQENHETAHKLEQSQLQEQLKLQYECSSSYAVHELESQIENLENELKREMKESADALGKISELEVHVKSLEKELECKSRGFEADLEALTCSKVEQEQRAIRAEEALRKTQWKNAVQAERLQEGLKRLTAEVTSTFAANEKLATNAMAEASELRLQKSHLEEVIQKAYEEHQSVKDHYEAKLDQLSRQVMLMTKQMEQMWSGLEEKVLQLEHQEKNAEETHKLLSEEISKLKDEIVTCMAKNKILLEEIEGKDALILQLEQTKLSIKEMESLLDQGNRERTELENRILLVKHDSEESHKELHKMRCIVEEKELIAGRLKTELDLLKSQLKELKDSITENELEKEKLRKRVFLLQSRLNESEDALNQMEKKIKDDGHGEAASLNGSKPTSESDESQLCASQEVARLMDRISLLEDQVKSKEGALQTSNKTYLEKEKNLCNKIEESDGSLEVLTKSNIHHSAHVEGIALEDNHDGKLKMTEQVRNNDEDSSAKDKTANVHSCPTFSRQRNDNNNMHSAGQVDQLQSQMALLKERNEAMEAELMEMQNRYSEISLKFAEVEGERQQLVMKVRKLKNTKKRS